MVVSLNEVNLLGYLGYDPKQIKSSKGTVGAKIALATNNMYRDVNGNKVEKVQWHDLVAWGKNAEIINEFCKKGQLVLVKGSIEYSEYEKDDIIYRHTTILVKQIQIMPYIPRLSAQNTTNSEKKIENTPSPNADSDLAFMVENESKDPEPVLKDTVKDDKENTDNENIKKEEIPLEIPF